MYQRISSFVLTNINKKTTFHDLKLKDVLYEIEKLFINMESGETIKISEVKKHTKIEEELILAENKRNNIRLC